MCMCVPVSTETRGIRTSRAGVTGGGEPLTDTETKLKPFEARVMSALNHWAIPPAQTALFLCPAAIRF